MGVVTKSKSVPKKPVVHPNTWVFYKGEFGRYHDIKLGLMTHALHYGTGVFEGIRAYWNPRREQLFLLQAPAHFERLRRSANVMRFTVPYSTEDLVNLTIELLRRNEFKSDVYIRPLLFTASEEIGVRLHNLDQGFFIYAIPFGNYVEIEGHTDSTGDKVTNQRLGEARAEAVKRYLYEAHQVPLHKMNVISYGAEKPVSPNTTREGRAQNRRVVIRILA